MALPDSTSPTSRHATARPTLSPLNNTSRSSPRTMSHGSIMLHDSDDEAVLNSSKNKAKARSAMGERAPGYQPQSSPNIYSTDRHTEPSKSPAIDEDDLNVIDSDDDETLEEDVTPEAFATVQNISIPAGSEQLEFAATLFDQIVSRGVSVELDDGAFMRVAVVVRDRVVPHKILVGGNLLQRQGTIDRRVGRHGWELYSWMPRRKNELCAIVRTTVDGEAPKLGESLIFRSLDQIGLVREVTFTNMPWDEDTEEASKIQKYKFRCADHKRGLTSADQSCLQCRENREANAPLICRWKYVQEVDMQRKKAVGWQIIQLERDECDFGQGLNPVSRLTTFRGLDQRQTQDFKPSDNGSDFDRNSPKHQREAGYEGDEPGDGRKRAKRLVGDLVDLTLDDCESGPSTRVPNAHESIEEITVMNPDTGEVEHFVFPTDDNKQNPSHSHRKEKGKVAVRPPLARRPPGTFMDICAGCGGTARGAKMAGLELKCLVDIMPEACQSLRVNFEHDDEVVLEMDITDFAQNGEVYRADVMHVSFPCQGFSGLNRGQNPEEDAKNIAISYGTFGKLLKKCKPRIVTMEQVRGILHKDDGQHLRSQIHALVQQNYNVRWASHVLGAYGNPQQRNRVIIIASCPGQTLPSWPARTHGPGLAPFVTIADILDQVRRPGYNREAMEHAVKRKPGKLVPYDPNVPVTHCITSGGGFRAGQRSNNYHPSGTRDFTYQEKAQLQGFPWYHRFYGGIVKLGKQIGNAVPPVFAEKLFRSCIKALEETDKLVDEYLTPIDLD